MPDTPDTPDFSGFNGWDYRVIEHDEDPGGDYLAIHEVYYFKEDGESIPKGYTEDAISPRGDDFEELKDDLGYYLKALEKPILKQSEFNSEE